MKLFTILILAATVSFGQIKYRSSDTSAIRSLDSSYNVYINQIEGIAEVKTRDGIVYIKCTQSSRATTNNHYIEEFGIVKYYIFGRGYFLSINPNDVIKFTPNQSK